MPFDFHRLKSGYHAARLRASDQDLETIAGEMRRYPATANVSQWFAAWDREAVQRASDMERDVGLAPGHEPATDFIDAARRAIVFELGGTLRRTTLASLASLSAR